MSNPACTLLDLIELKTVWQKTEHGAQVHYSERGHSGSVDVTNEELHALHPNLVHVLSHHFQQLARSNTVPWFSSEVIKYTLRFWQGLPTMSDKYTRGLIVMQIDDVAEMADGRIDLELEACVIEKAGAISYVTRTEQQYLCYRPEELDALYPGWRERMQILESLGQEENLLLSYVFTESPVPLPSNAALPDNML